MGRVPVPGVTVFAGIPVEKLAGRVPRCHVSSSDEGWWRRRRGGVKGRWFLPEFSRWLQGHGVAPFGLTQIKDRGPPVANDRLLTSGGGEVMSPYLMQPFVIGPVIVGLLFAFTLLAVSISDATKG
jgi:hypothetical protein